MTKKLVKLRGTEDFRYVTLYRNRKFSTDKKTGGGQISWASCNMSQSTVQVVFPSSNRPMAHDTDKGFVGFLWYLMTLPVFLFEMTFEEVGRMRQDIVAGTYDAVIARFHDITGLDVSQNSVLFQQFKKPCDAGEGKF